MSDNKFLKGAAILGLAGVLVKVMGIFFRIPLTIWVGADGMSYYGSVYPIYTFFLTLSTAGIPVAISRMVSERIAVNNYGGAHKVFRTSLAFLSTIGLITFLICYLGAGYIETEILRNPGTSLALQAIAPSLLLVPVMAAYRGYFQGRQNMNPTAISQTFEQLIRVIVGLGLAYFLLKAGNEVAVAGATFGATAGACAGLIVVVLIYILGDSNIRSKIEKNKKFEELEKSQTILKQILIIAIPITIGAAIFPMLSSIDSMVVMGRLIDTGWSEDVARDLWGRLSGYCNSLIGVPQVFTQAVVMSLVPAIAAAYKTKNKSEVQANTKLGMRTAMIIGFPCAVGMFALAEPILHLLYKGRMAEASAAAPTLQLMCVGIIFMSALQTMTGTLQGVNKQMLPVKNLAIGAVVKLVVTYVLVGIKVINVNGAPIGTIAAYITATLLNQRDLKKHTGTEFDYMTTYIKPGICSVLMGLVTFATYKLLFLILKSNTMACLMAIIVAVAVYVILVLLTKTITKEEISLLPKGKKIVRILDKFIK